MATSETATSSHAIEDTAEASTSQEPVPKVRQDLSQIQVEPKFIDDDVKPLKEQEIDEIDEDLEADEDDVESNENIEGANNKEDRLKDCDDREVTTCDNKFATSNTKASTDTSNSGSTKKSKKRKSTGERVSMANSDEVLQNKKQKISPKSHAAESSVTEEKSMKPESLHKKRRELNKWARGLPKYKSLKASRSGLFQVSEKDATQTSMKVKSSIAKGT